VVVAFDLVLLDPDARIYDERERPLRERAAEARAGAVEVAFASSNVAGIVDHAARVGLHRRAQRSLPGLCWT